MKHWMIAVTWFVLLLVGNAYESLASDLDLTRKCSPILILPEDTAGEYSVLKPEPVEIVGADSSSNLWFEAFRLGADKAGDYQITANWVPSLAPFIEEWHPGVELQNNKFAFLDHGEDEERIYPSLGGILGLPGNHLIKNAHFDYPGKTPAVWDSVYFGKGRFANNANKGNNFPNTAYAHVYKTTHETYTDSITVIQYFYFYPYNDWHNNHEGDWPQVRVIVNTRNPNDENFAVLGVEYTFHGAHFSYYEDYNSKPDITSNFVFNPREEIKLIQDTHPVVYVAPGSHGLYPTGGRFRAYRLGLDNAPGSEVIENWENMSHTGLVLSTMADDSNSEIWELYNIKLLPVPNPDLDNMGLADTLSWLGANVRWGTPEVSSPLTGSFVGERIPSGSLSLRLGKT